MQHRIATLTQKLSALGANISTRGLIDVDLMLDYTRVLYADLTELRQEMTARTQMHIHEPTLDELTEAMLAAEENEAEEENDLLPEPPPPAQFPTMQQATPQPVVAPLETPAPQPERNAALPPRPLPGMAPKKLKFEDLVGINDRYLFQQELFHNDHVLYHKAIEEINSGNNINDVNEWLERHVPGHRHWDLYSEAGSTFYALLNRFFEQQAKD